MSHNQIIKPEFFYPEETPITIVGEGYKYMDTVGIISYYYSRPPRCSDCVMGTGLATVAADKKIPQ